MERAPNIKKILLTGGGTAGHVNPALAIGKALAGPGTTLLFVGVKGRAEETVVPKEGIPIRFVRASGFPGATPSVALLRFFLDLTIGTLQAARILLGFHPDVIIGTGGFVSAPVVFAAALLSRLRLRRIPVYLHEQNAVPGKLNQIAGRLARHVFVTFPESLSYFPANGVLTGYPLRSRIRSIPPAEARQKLDFLVPEDRTAVFIFGGSQGARSINRAVVDSLRYLMPHKEKIFLIHGMGLFKSSSYNAETDTVTRLLETYSKAEREIIATFYAARPYFHEIENVYGVSTLAVVRAGAGTLNELATLGLPAIVIPKANLPGDHQVANARALQRAGGADVIYEETVVENGAVTERIEGSVLAQRILDLAADPFRRAEMSRSMSGFLRREALHVIETAIRNGQIPPAPPVTEDEPSGELLSNKRLLTRLEKEARAAGSQYQVCNVIKDPGDLDYFRSRAASLLASEEWEVRNTGVKLLGLLEAGEKIPLILALLADKTKAPFLERLLGGDFVQVGFIRRNAVIALSRIGIVTPEVEDALLDAFNDPYYEVRSEAAHAAARFDTQLTRRKDVIERLSLLIHDRDIEVASSAAMALGVLGTESDALPVLLGMREREFWKIRSAVLRGILKLVERGKVSDLPALREKLMGFPLISTDFVPQFELKSNYRRLLETVSDEQGKRS